MCYHVVLIKPWEEYVQTQCVCVCLQICLRGIVVNCNKERRVQWNKSDAWWEHPQWLPLCKVAQISEWHHYGSEQLRERLGLHPRHLPTAETNSRKNKQSFLLVSTEGYLCCWKAAGGKRLCSHEDRVQQNKQISFLNTLSTVNTCVNGSFSLDGEEEKLF